MNAQVGMRVKVTRGTWKSYNLNARPPIPEKEKGTHDCQLFCGGDVPVGSVGTITRVRVFPENHPNPLTMLAIDFDNIKPKGDFRFGLEYGPLPDWLEVVEKTDT